VIPSIQPDETVGEDMFWDRRLPTLDTSKGFTAPPEDTRILEEQLLSITDNLSA